MKILHTLFENGSIMEFEGFYGSAEEIRELTSGGDWDALAAKIIEVLRFYDIRGSILQIEDEDEIEEYDDLLGSILEAIGCEDFVVPEAHQHGLVYHSAVFHNMLMLSRHGDAYNAYTKVVTQPREKSLPRLLFLVNPRNNGFPDIKGLYKANPSLVSWWWCVYVSSVNSTGTADGRVHANINWAFENLPDDFEFFNQFTMPTYFLTTYLAPEKEAKIKGIFHRSLKKLIKNSGIEVKNTPRKKSVAIVTSKWFKGAAIYRTNKPYVDALRERGYDLTLVALAEEPMPTIDEEGFSKVLHYDMNGKSDKEIIDNDFELALFPDIGMNDYSVWFANIRLAPIQVMALGHPVSTFGAEIDYVISGQDAELASKAKENYTERVVLIPGIGSDVNKQTYSRKKPRKLDDVFIVNCPWTPFKINNHIVGALAEAQNRSEREIVYNFLPSQIVNFSQGAFPFWKDIKDNLIADITPNQGWQKYMEIMEHGHLTLVPYHFGSYNTVVDSLLVGLPVIAIEGEKWYNRCAPGLLRMTGLGGLIAGDIDEYADLIVRLANDGKVWSDFVGIAENVDLDQTVFNTNTSEYFADAIDHIIKNHGKDDSREPIVIKSLRPGPYG